MSFREKYVITAEALKPENKDKIAVSNDAFALGDIIQELINKIEHVRCDLEDG